MERLLESCHSKLRNQSILHVVDKTVIVEKRKEKKNGHHYKTDTRENFEPVIVPLWPGYLEAQPISAGTFRSAAALDLVHRLKPSH